MYRKCPLAVSIIGLFLGDFSCTAISERALLFSSFLQSHSAGLLLVDYVERLTGRRGSNGGRELLPRTIHIRLVLRQKSEGWRIAY